jgi:hypothetical protein
MSYRYLILLWLVNDAEEIPEPLRRDLLRYPLKTSAERARVIGQLTERNPGMADILIELEADGDLRARFEMELLNSSEPRR